MEIPTIILIGWVGANVNGKQVRFHNDNNHDILEERLCICMQPLKEKRGGEMDWGTVAANESCLNFLTEASNRNICRYLKINHYC